jgi:hypothetical protein
VRTALERLRMLNRWRRNREAKTKRGSKYAVGRRIFPTEIDEGSIPALLNGGGCSYLTPVPEEQPYDKGGVFADTWFRAVIPPDECILSPKRGYRCVREDHEHGDDDE